MGVFAFSVHLSIALLSTSNPSPTAVLPNAASPFDTKLCIKTGHFHAQFEPELKLVEAFEMSGI